MATDRVRLELSSAPDAYGFIYGQPHRGDEHHNVNVLPPKRLWAGQFELDGYEPDETDWILYVDGEEVARVQERNGVEHEFHKVLLEG